MTGKRKLPIGIQSFGKLRREGYYYADKTPFAWQLSQEAGYFFLARPRRFGKSLFLDTLKELFEGHEALFQNLYIHDKWDWQQKHPVIRISFADGVMQSREELDKRIHYLLETNRKALNLPESSAPDIAGEFAELIRHASQHYNTGVVVLIDEYDKPILDNLTNETVALQMREGLKNLYSVLKDADPYLRFCFLTGVSKFSKVSLFSGLNNLNDISLNGQYGAICGYTQQDLKQVFASEMEGLDPGEVQRWYNGYQWLGEPVYNPFDLLLFFQQHKFQPYWFESATPSFLINLLAERGLYTPQLAALQTNSSLLSQFDVQDISTEALLFQTGYLTIKQAEEPITGMWVYTLGYPNHEVQTSLNEALLPAYGLPAPQAQQARLQLLQALQNNDLNALELHFKTLFANLPHDWYRNNPIAQYEGHYASVFYSHLAALGMDITVEDASNNGKVDMAVRYQNQIWLFEFKVVEQLPEGKALQQLKDKGYADKYRGTNHQIQLIGVEFSKQQRQIIGFEVEST